MRVTNNSSVLSSAFSLDKNELDLHSVVHQAQDIVGETEDDTDIALITEDSVV